MTVYLISDDSDKDDPKVFLDHAYCRPQPDASTAALEEKPGVKAKKKKDVVPSTIGSPLRNKENTPSGNQRV